MKTYKELLTEAKGKTAKDLKKELESSDWGYTEAGGNGRVKMKGKNIIIYDSYYYGGDKALKNHITKWSPGGENAAFFEKDGYTFKVINSGSNVTSTVYKSKASGGGGDVWVELEIN
jgi:hypothetical protein